MRRSASAPLVTARGDGRRVRARRADASRSTPSSTSTLTPEQQHARALRVAKLWILVQRATRQLDHVRAAYHAELLYARREQISYAVIGDAILVATGAPRTARTAEALARIEGALRVATHTALQRVKAANAEHVDHGAESRDGDRMRRAPIMVREYWFEPPSTGLGGLDVGDDYNLDDLDERLRERERDPRDARDDREHDNSRERDAREHDAHNREDR